MAVTRTETWLRCRLENGPAASEPRRRSEWLLHGPDPTRIQPNTRSRRDALRLMAGSPRVVPVVPDPIHSPTPPDSRRSIGVGLWIGCCYRVVEGKGGRKRHQELDRKLPIQGFCEVARHGGDARIGATSLKIPCVGG